MKQYKELLQDIKENGEWKDPAREGMPRTKSIFSRSKRFDLTQGFPALTLKKLYWKGVIGELIWFLQGDTNIKYLVDNGIHIWDGDSYKFHNNVISERFNSSIINGNINYTKEEFLDNLGKSIIDECGSGSIIGDCGNIYGSQWRSFGYTEYDSFIETGFDQIKYLVKNIKENPNSRYNRVTAWNPLDFIRNPEQAALPACHTDFQIYIRQGEYLDLDMNQRSCDTFLGVPFNIASYALLTHILADLTGYYAGELIWNGKDIHYYENHQEQVDEALNREPLELPILFRSDNYLTILNKYKEDQNLDEFLNGLKIDDFDLQGYKSHAIIKAPLSVGL